MEWHLFEVHFIYLLVIHFVLHLVKKIEPGINASSGITLGLKGQIPVEAKPLTIFSAFMLDSRALANRPGQVCFVIL